MIKLIKSSFYNEKKTKKALANFILNADILSMNKQCEEFEKKFAKKQNRKLAVFVSSGSSANLILIQSLLNLGKLKRGDKIGFSSLTWATNVMPLLQLGLVPIALDCSLETLNVSPKELEKKIKSLKGLFLTNVLGFCDDINKIKDICRRNNIVFIEDNCESLGSMVGKKLLGNFGIASTFSFFVGHHLSTIEGGMICTDDKELYNMLVMARAHGWDRNLLLGDQKKIRKKYNVDDFYAKYTFYDLAYNARPMEITGFLGNAQINYWDEIVLKRENNFNLFQRKIKQNNDFMPLGFGHMSLVSNFAMPLICKSKDLYKKYKEKFERSGVEIRPIIAGNIEKQPFYKKYIQEKSECKNSDFAHKNGFYFPNNPELVKKETDLICNLLKK
ncbi:MAG: aminotransferase class V-fold PLP-dependent enzyme [Patescibacteria group bacterium]